MGSSVLIVYAHQSPKSFNAAVKDLTVKELTRQGYNVTVSDLYAMDFKATATRDDIKGELKDPEHFRYGDESGAAWKSQTLSDDIVAEHKKITEADLIIFQFPMYWFTVPGIMKGWFDRVFSPGFAFSLENLYDQGIFKKKKAMLSFTTGGLEPMFFADGLHGDMNVILWPLQNCTLHFCGFQVLAPQIFYAPAHCKEPERKLMLQKWEQRLKNGLLSEPTLKFAPCSVFDLGRGASFRLRNDVLLGLENHGLTTGQHAGKALPPNDQIRAPPKDAEGTH